MIKTEYTTKRGHYVRVSLTIAKRAYVTGKMVYFIAPGFSPECRIAENVTRYDFSSNYMDAEADFLRLSDLYKNNIKAFHVSGVEYYIKKEA